jgi:hypothetical protein
VPGQVLIKPGDIRPIAGTKDKTLRALAIHIVQNQLAGPYAGINPETVNAAGKPGEMIPVRVEFTLGKESSQRSIARQRCTHCSKSGKRNERKGS